MNFKLYFDFILYLLIGLSVFLFGLKIMSDGLEQIASKNMRKILSKISDNRLVGVATGTGVTAALHSSTAMTVMIIGFVNANMMSLTQAAGLIFGANIGTTVTGLLVALGSYDIKVFLSFPIVIGMVVSFLSKKDTIKKTGYILIGVGLIFIGLDLMSESVKTVSNTSEFIAIFESIKNPLLLMLIGILVTAILQSSTAVNSIILVLAAQGVMPIVSGLYIILGTNIGTCFTALIASAGVNTNAKRASLIHLIFNVLGTIIFALVFIICDAVDPTLLERLIRRLFGTNTMFQIAWFNFFQNLICTIVLLPFLNQIVKFVTVAIKEKDTKLPSKDFKYINESFIGSSAIAITQVLMEVSEMEKISRSNLDIAIDSLLNGSIDNKEKLEGTQKQINNLDIGITNFLVKILGTNINKTDKILVGSLFHIVNSLERINDHAGNLINFSENLLNNSLTFSEEAHIELILMSEKILKLFDLASEIYEKRERSLLRDVDIRQVEIAQLTKAFSANHIKRMSEGICNPETGIIFYGIITHLERVADHLKDLSYNSCTSPKRKVNLKSLSKTKKI